MFCIEYDWKTNEDSKLLNVNLASFELWLRENSVVYAGNTAGAKLQLWFSEEPEQEVKDAIDEYWEELEGLTPQELANQAAIIYTEALVERAMAFGNKIIKEFAAENIRLGITQDGKTAEVRVKMAEVLNALSTGSLYDAIDQAQLIDDFDAKYVTEARINSFIAKIQAYLAG